MRSTSSWMLVALVALMPANAFAHTYIMEPPSRDTAIANLDERAHKFGPCGGKARTGMPTQYAVGATIEVKYQETIDHRGCFQVAFSPANDDNWVTLGQWNDPIGSPDDQITTRRVTLPAGVSCKDCTLVVRQLMIGQACAPNAVPPPGDTYFSCADIRVGDFADAGPTQQPSPLSDASVDDEDEETTGAPDGSSPTASDGGAKASSRGYPSGYSAPEPSSCNASSWGAPGGVSLFASLGFSLLAVARRARRAKSASPRR